MIKQNLPIFVLTLLSSCFDTQKTEMTQGLPTHITTQVGQQFVFSLPARYSAGYKWILSDTSFKGDFIKIIDDAYTIERNALIGGKGTQTFTFKALKKGDALITLFYKRPWEKNIEQTHLIHITIE